MEHRLAIALELDAEILDPLNAAFAEWNIELRPVVGGAGLDEALELPGVRFVVAGSGVSGGAFDSLLAQLSRLNPQPMLIATAPLRECNAKFWGDHALFDMLPKPAEPAQLDLTVRRAVRQQLLLDEVHALRRDLRAREGYHGIVGRSRAMERLREELARLAPSAGPVWLHGEEGCGKKLAARTLHERSGRRQAAFVEIDCESQAADGRFESRLALGNPGEPATGGVWHGLHGGTLMVTEPAALDRVQQRALLDSLERARSAGIDARCIVVSRLSPERQVEEGRLIGDLVGRLAVDALWLAPLHERREDIPLLAAHFVETICTINRLPPIRIGGDAMQRLDSTRFSDNVRGLRNAMEQAAIVCADGTIRAQDLPQVRSVASTVASGPSAAPDTHRERSFRKAKGRVVEAFELDYLSALMRRHMGNVTAASQEAGMLRSALQRLLRKYGLRSSSFRRSRGAQAAPDIEETRTSHP